MKDKCLMCKREINTHTKGELRVCLHDVQITLGEKADLSGVLKKEVYGLRQDILADKGWIKQQEQQIKELEHYKIESIEYKKYLEKENQKNKEIVDKMRCKIKFYEVSMPEFLKDHPEIRDTIVKNFKEILGETG